MSVEIRSNEQHFTGMRYFPPSSDLEGQTPADYTLNFCNLNVDTPWDLQALSKERDRSYRGGRFAAGYYITDHFGSPAYLVTRESHYWVYAADFEAMLWPYFVKLLLTIHSMKLGLLHLKAASIAVDGAGILLVGRGEAARQFY